MTEPYMQKQQLTPNRLKTNTVKMEIFEKIEQALLSIFIENKLDSNRNLLKIPTFCKSCSEL